MEQTINSKWSKETGQWDEKAGKYINRVITILPDKTLTMTIGKGYSGKVLSFEGGPTGYESYYVKDLLEPRMTDSDSFCICAGTINSYPRCEVSFAEVLKFLNEEVTTL